MSTSELLSISALAVIAFLLTCYSAPPQNSRACQESRGSYRSQCVFTEAHQSTCCLISKACFFSLFHTLPYCCIGSKSRTGMLVIVAFHIQFLETALVTAQTILVGKMKLIRSRSTPQDSVDAHAGLSMPHPATLRPI